MLDLQKVDTRCAQNIQKEKRYSVLTSNPVTDVTSTLTLPFLYASKRGTISSSTSLAFQSNVKIFKTNGSVVVLSNVVGAAQSQTGVAVVILEDDDICN